MKTARAYILGVLVQLLILLLALGGGYDNPADLEAIAVAISVDGALPQALFRACHAVYSQGGRRALERNVEDRANLNRPIPCIYGHAEDLPASEYFHAGALLPLDASSAHLRIGRDPCDQGPQYVSVGSLPQPVVAALDGGDDLASDPHPLWSTVVLVFLLCCSRQLVSLALSSWQRSLRWRRLCFIGSGPRRTSRGSRSTGLAYLSST